MEFVMMSVDLSTDAGRPDDLIRTEPRVTGWDILLNRFFDER